MDKFTVVSNILNPAAGDTVAIYLDDQTGTYAHSAYGSNTLDSTTTTSTKMDISPVSTGTTSASLYVIVYVTSATTGGKVNFDFKVTKQ